MRVRVVRQGGVITSVTVVDDGGADVLPVGRFLRHVEVSWLWWRL
jgi:hypothetical protein